MKLFSFQYAQLEWSQTQQLKLQLENKGVLIVLMEKFQMELRLALHVQVVHLMPILPKLNALVQLGVKYRILQMDSAKNVQPEWPLQTQQWIIRLAAQLVLVPPQLLKGYIYIY